MAEEFAARCRRGEAPSIAEYEARFPADAAKVRKLLETVAMMEQLRRGSKQARFLPERLGEFRVLRELGRGGMGVVYEAVQESLWRHVAVKAMHHIHLDPKRLQRFQREAQAVAQLHHTNIVPIFGVGEHDGLPYYVMQYIKGHGLDVELDRWRKEGAPSPEQRWKLAARVGIQAGRAMQYAHDQGILHRDIKPSNLLVDEQGSIWITDFGLAKLSGHDDLTASGDVIGTLRYLAPRIPPRPLRPPERPVQPGPDALRVDHPELALRRDEPERAAPSGLRGIADATEAAGPDPPARPGDDPPQGDRPRAGPSL